MHRTKSVIWIAREEPHPGGDEWEEREELRFSVCRTEAAGLESLSRAPADALVADLDALDGRGEEFLRAARRYDLSVRILLYGRPAPGGTELGAMVSYLPQAPNSRWVAEWLGAAPEAQGRAFIGKSPGIRAVKEMVRLVGPRRATVLITGETGTGKEVVARAIHESGARGKGRFVAVNCSALPDTLLEAELFGHVKGAFTGAIQSREGRFEEARDGSIFLDEIGEMPVELQAKLLRVLQEREFQRLGSSEGIPMRARVITATNADLADKVRRGQFRGDLFYRLNVIPIELPPLRQRREDIGELAEHFVERVCQAESLPRKRLEAEALALLEEYGWPGNVRELENVIEMAVVLSGSRLLLTKEDFRPVSGEGAPPSQPPSAIELPDTGLNFDEVVGRFEMNLLSQALHRTAGNKKLAADLLGLKRTTLSAKVRSLQALAGCATG